MFALPLTAGATTTQELIATIKFLQERVIILQYQLSVIEASKPKTELKEVIKTPAKINGRDCGLLLQYAGKCMTIAEWKKLKAYQ